MSCRGANLVLALLLLAALASPILAAQADCAAGDEEECCGRDCPLCLCCSHLPRPFPEAASFGVADEPSTEIDAENGLDLAAPAPRDILHVPKPTSFG